MLSRLGSWSTNSTKIDLSLHNNNGSLVLSRLPFCFFADRLANYLKTSMYRAMYLPRMSYSRLTLSPS